MTKCLELAALPVLLAFEWTTELKYGASEASFGSKNAGGIPVGRGRSGHSSNYQTEKMPPVNVGLIRGQLAWRQHNGDHTDCPNWKHFIPWANRMLGYRPEVD